LAASAPIGKKRQWLLLVALALAVFSTWLITVTFQLLLVDIAHSFHVEVGTAGLVAAVGSISGIAAGLLMAVLSIRFNHKLFLLVGLASTCLAAVGFYLAPNFGVLLATNIAVGTGIAFATSMAYSLIGDFFSLESRGKAVGALVAATALSYVVGAPLIGVLDSFGGWRQTIIWLAFPVALASLVYSAIIVPNASPKIQVCTQRETFLAGCKQAVSSRSAFSILIVTALSMAEGSIGFYATSFFRQQFSMSIQFGSLLIVAGNILSAVGGALSGLLVNRVGRKPLGTATFLTAALFTLAFTFTPHFTISWVLSTVRFFFSGMAFTAGGSLVMEQLPKFRATMMSLNTAAMNVGMLLGSVTADFTLNSFGYQALAVSLGSFGILGAIMWMSLVSDPYAKQKDS
jgi:predicted MFS family arabinose efflux permease